MSSFARLPLPLLFFSFFFFFDAFSSTRSSQATTLSAFPRFPLLFFFPLKQIVGLGSSARLSVGDGVLGAFVGFIVGALLGDVGASVSMIGAIEGAVVGRALGELVGKELGFSVDGVLGLHLVFLALALVPFRQRRQLPAPLREATLFPRHGLHFLPVLLKKPFLHFLHLMFLLLVVFRSKPTLHFFGRFGSFRSCVGLGVGRGVRFVGLGVGRGFRRLVGLGVGDGVTDSKTRCQGKIIGERVPSAGQDTYHRKLSRQYGLQQQAREEISPRTEFRTHL